jgi:hypothetical protein
MMMATLRITGASAGLAYTSWALSAAMVMATKLMNATDGNSQRVRSMVRANLAASLAKPLANACTNHGAATMPMTTMIINASSKPPSTRAKNARAASSPSVVRSFW